MPNKPSSNSYALPNSRKKDKRISSGVPRKKTGMNVGSILEANNNSMGESTQIHRANTLNSILIYTDNGGICVIVANELTLFIPNL